MAVADEDREAAKIVPSGRKEPALVPKSASVILTFSGRSWDIEDYGTSLFLRVQRGAELVAVEWPSGQRCHTNHSPDRRAPCSALVIAK